MADRLTAPTAREQALALTALAAVGVITAAWWALALWPTPPSGGEWLARTRAVCFGAAPGGLPDAAGWALLVGQPLGMTLVLLVGWRHAIAAGLLRLARVPAGRVALGAAAAVLLLGAGAATVRVADAASPTDVGAVAPGGTRAEHRLLDRPSPSSLRLTDHSGRPFALASVRGRPVLLTFAFAHCETVCPVLVRNVLEAQRLAGGVGSADRRPAVVIVTVDPWRDTPTRLPHVARDWALPPDAYLLGGGVDAVLRELGAWEVSIRRDPRTGDVTHPALVYVLDGAGRIRFTATGGGGYLAALAARL